MRYFYIYYIVILTVLIKDINSLSCLTPNGPCKCTTDQGEIDLSPLDNTNGGARFTNIQGPGDNNVYNYNPCTEYKDDNCDSNTLSCLQEFSQWHVAGSASSASWAPSSDGSGDLAVSVSQADSIGTTRTTEVKLHCDPSQEGSMTAQTTPDFTYHLTLTSKYACPGTTGGGGSGGGLSVGSILCILLVVLVFVYVVGGMLFMHFVKGASGKEMVPNVTFWVQVPVLVKDGMLYVVAKVKGERSTASSSGYESF